MAQWQALSRLCQQDSNVQKRVIDLYRRINFPYKLRSQFSTWIEQQDWSVKNRDLSIKTLIQEQNRVFPDPYWGSWILMLVYSEDR